MNAVDETTWQGRADSPEPFDLCGELPTGTCVLEASAGTGKTHAITALAVRHVAEGRVRLDQIMMVTFSRAATSELRHRVYTRLMATVVALDAWLQHGTTPTDEVDRLLVAAPREEVALRRARVHEALTEIDRATIATTHEFCARMLAGLGLLVDHDATTRFTENIDELASQVVHDVYLAGELSGSATPPARMATFARYQEVGRAALYEPDARLVPVEATALSASRVAFAEQVRQAFEERKRRAGLYTYDDMVRRLRDALLDERTGEDAARALSSRYPLVLIDEFQDTDPTQWQIVERAFVGRSTVVLIGDPKQAIYAFRGADVNAYLAAVEQADRVWTLPTNHRSDAGVVRGVLQVFAGTAMGSPRILPRPVGAAHAGSRLVAPADASSAPVQIRSLVAPGSRGFSSWAGGRAVDDDLAAEVVGLLTDGWQVDEGGVLRTLRPSDIAVLVRSNKRGDRIKQVLEAAGVSAVFGGAETVMASEAATAWLQLLRALAEPSSATMKRAALSCLLGWSEAELAAAVQADEQADGPSPQRTVPELAVQVKMLARVLHSQGVAAVFEALCDQTQLPARILARSDGERLMTDLRHVAQLLNDAAHRSRLAPAALVEWLAEHVEQARRSKDDDRTRRLETDASCVQVMTIHAAKGLEFPVVLLPQAADEWTPEPQQGRPSVMYLDGERVLDVGVDGQWPHRQQVRLAQERAEALRTLYVAMTRAKSRLVMWWAPIRQNTEQSALHRLLQGPRVPGGQPDAGYPTTALPSRVPGLAGADVAVVEAEPRTPGRWQRPAVEVPELSARSFTRQVDTTWRRTSYSGLTAEVHGQHLVELDDEHAAQGDEVELEPGGPTSAAVLPDAEGSGAPLDDPALAQVTALAPLPGGTQFGSLVHGVLEKVSFTSPTLGDDLARELAHQAARLPVDGLDQQALVTGLQQVLDTPLGVLAGGDGRMRLRELADVDRLPELDFELPMGHGSGSSTLAAVARALQDERLTGADPFAARYGAHLAVSPAATKTLNGFLVGSIDVVMRVPGPEGQRFVVLDYKTNRMPVAEGEQLTVGHYRAEPMARAMVEAHYPLQALLYCVALHRFLRWRLPGYDPAKHLGGAGYLFVRGMAGASTPVDEGMPCGVFTWQPSPALVVRVDELLGGM